jgi:hypothetical protein
MVRKLAKGALGDTDPPYARRPTIRILRSLRGRERLRVVIHELAHATDWSLPEETVRLLAAGIGKGLWTLGYRLTEEK